MELNRNETMAKIRCFSDGERKRDREQEENKKYDEMTQ